jgi:hypothetical protein
MLFSKYKLSSLEYQVGKTKIKLVIDYIKAGYNRLDDIAKVFGISEKQAWMIYMIYQGFKYQSAEILGSKTEQYYQEDLPIIGSYNLEDLTGDELEIANSLPEPFKFIEMGKMKEIFIEVYEKHEGNVPDGYTLNDYLAEVNENRRLQELKSLQDYEKRKDSTQVPSREKNSEFNQERLDRKNESKEV